MSDPKQNNDFEKQLKQEAEQFTPKPSPEVWEKLKDELHPERGTYPLAIAALILLLLASGVYFLQRKYWQSPPKKQLTVYQSNPAFSPAISNHSSGIPGKSFQETVKSKKENLPNHPSGLSSPGMEKQAHAPANNFLVAEKGYSGTNDKIIHQPASETFKKAIPFESVILKPLPKISPVFSVTKLSAETNPIRIFQPEWILTSSDSDFGREKESFHKNAIKTPRKVSDKKPYFQVSFTSGIGYRVLKNGVSGNWMNAAPSVGQIYQNMPAGIHSLYQRPEWSWSTGARIGFPFGNTWSFQTGLSISEFNYHIRTYGTYPVSTFYTYRQNTVTANRPLSSTNLNVLAMSRPKAVWVSNSYSFAEVPFLIQKGFGNPNKISFNIGAGAGISYLFHSNAIIYSPTSGVYFKDGHFLKSFNSELYLETTMLIPLSPKWKIEIGPSIEYQIFSSYKNYPRMKEHPYLMGIRTGLQWGW